MMWMRMKIEEKTFSPFACPLIFSLTSSFTPPPLLHVIITIMRMRMRMEMNEEVESRKEDHLHDKRILTLLLLLFLHTLQNPMSQEKQQQVKSLVESKICIKYVLLSTTSTYGIISHKQFIIKVVSYTDDVYSRYKVEDLFDTQINTYIDTQIDRYIFTYLNKHHSQEEVVGENYQVT